MIIVEMKMKSVPGFAFRSWFLNVFFSRLVFISSCIKNSGTTESSNSEQFFQQQESLPRDESLRFPVVFLSTKMRGLLFLLPLTSLFVEAAIQKQSFYSSDVSRRTRRSTAHTEPSPSSRSIAVGTTSTQDAHAAPICTLPGLDFVEESARTMSQSFRSSVAAYVQLVESAHQAGVISHAALEKVRELGGRVEVNSVCDETAESLALRVTCQVALQPSIPSIEEQVKKMGEEFPELPSAAVVQNMGAVLQTLLLIETNFGPYLRAEAINQAAAAINQERTGPVETTFLARNPVSSWPDEHLRKWSAMVAFVGQAFKKQTNLERNVDPYLSADKPLYVHDAAAALAAFAVLPPRRQ